MSKNVNPVTKHSDLQILSSTSSTAKKENTLGPSVHVASDSGRCCLEAHSSPRCTQVIRVTGRCGCHTSHIPIAASCLISAPASTRTLFSGDSPRVCGRCIFQYAKKTKCRQFQKCARRNGVLIFLIVSDNFLSFQTTFYRFRQLFIFSDNFLRGRRACGGRQLFIFPDNFYARQTTFSNSGRSMEFISNTIGGRKLLPEAYHWKYGRPEIDTSCYEGLSSLWTALKHISVAHSHQEAPAAPTTVQE